MPLELENVPIAFIFALGFACVIFIIVILITILSNIFSKESTKKQMEKKRIIKARTTGEQLNKIFMTAVIIFTFLIIGLLLMLSFFAFNSNRAFTDIWPFLVIAVTLLFVTLTTIDWTKLKTKRTIQREMRRY